MNDKDNYVYYNIRIADDNDTGKNIPAVYSENRTDVIIENPSLYEMTVERFRIPSTNIPLLNWRENTWAVTFSFDGLDETQYLQFVPNGYSGQQVFNIQEFIQSLNNATSTAFNVLKTAKPAAPPLTTPYFIFSPDTQLITLVIEDAFDPNVAPVTMKMYVNQPLFVYLSSLLNYNEQSLGNPFKAHQLLATNLYNNSFTQGALTFYNMIQTYSTVALFSDIAQIILETDTIPISQEKQPGQVAKTRRIITDFEPLQQADDNTSFQFFPQGPLRYYDLESKYPLRQIDVKIYWADKEGNKYLITIPPDDSLTIKLQFRKKYLPLEEIEY